MSNTYQLQKPSIPTINYAQAKAIYELDGHLEEFKHSMRSTRNDFLRNYLYQRQHGLCPYCGKRLLNVYVGTAVHHNSYDHYCTYNGPLIHVYDPQPGAIQTAVPNCKICYYKYPDKSEECLDALVMIHKECHARIHGHTERLKNQD